jgi:L-alanine-DL-glutamate epimerase-like enolase superfamily enzyme
VHFVEITHLEPMLFALPYDHGAPKPTLSTGITRTTMDAVYIRVDTDEGITGWGEAFGFGSCPITLEAARIMAVGRDPTDIAAFTGDLHRRLQSMALNGPLRYALCEFYLCDLGASPMGDRIWIMPGGT